MKVHLTGMSPRTASAQSRERTTFAGLLERALAIEGHLVTRDSYTTVDLDFTIVGVASPLSPAASYALSGLEAIGRAIDSGTPLVLFVDDPDLGKIKHGAVSALRDHSRLYTEYLMTKRIAVSRSPTDKQKVYIERGLEMLCGQHWAPVLLPMHAWGVGTEAMSAKRLNVNTEVVPLDMTSMLGERPVLAPRPAAEWSQMWLTEGHYSSAVLRQERVRWPVVPVDSATMEYPAEVYAGARGVHQGLAGNSPGWWTPTPLYAAQAGSVYLMDPLDQALVGSQSPYYLTPDYVESLSAAEIIELADQQRAYLKENTWILDQLLAQLEDLTGCTSSFVMPDTTTKVT